MDQLNSIGFYTLEDDRAANCSVRSPLWRCELLLTSRCNFNCPYCRKRTEPDIDVAKGYEIIAQWANEGLRNIRFSGGEPTLHPGLVKFVKMAKCFGIERIALSTNGSASQEKYQQLFDAGVNDFSISLDGCCAETINKMAGLSDPTNGLLMNRILSNIQFLSKLTYVTVGVVLTESNAEECLDTILTAHNLGVSDIRIIPAAQNGKMLPKLDVPQEVLEAHPILNYRIQNINNNRSVRGIGTTDNLRCPLVLDDMAIDELGNHYPCIIYMRERGKAIGTYNGCMKAVRQERLSWFANHNCKKDPICSQNCLDVCVDYNNRVKELQF